MGKGKMKHRTLRSVLLDLLLSIYELENNKINSSCINDFIIYMYEYFSKAFFILLQIHLTVRYISCFIHIHIQYVMELFFFLLFQCSKCGVDFQFLSVRKHHEQKCTQSYQGKRSSKAKPCNTVHLTRCVQSVT